MGNLTRDPEIRYTASNRAMARFNVAVNRTWKNRDGAVQEQTDFIPVVVWGPQAENCEKYLAKGRPVLIEGRIQTRSYEAKTGEKRYVTEVQGENVVFLGSGGGSGGSDYRRNDAPQENRREYAPQEGQRGGGDYGSLREEPFRSPSGGNEPFPMDISEMGSPGDADDGQDESDIPF
jgi:single-strand DNA-binding protein